MKKLSALVLAATVIASPLWAAIQTVNLSVPGMYCASCPFIVQGAIQELPGIQSIETDLDSRTAVVVFDDELTSIDDITFATLNVGYESIVIEAGS
jgi:mercuric ion binding protein